MHKHIWFIIAAFCVNQSSIFRFFRILPLSPYALAVSVLNTIIKKKTFQ